MKWNTNVQRSNLARSPPPSYCEREEVVKRYDVGGKAQRKKKDERQSLRKEQEEEGEGNCRGK